MGQLLTNEARAAIAKNWRGSGQTQEAYAAAHGVTGRTLRAWLARWSPPSRASPEVVRDLVEQTIERLRGLIVRLDSPDAVPAPRSDAKAPAAAPATAVPRRSPAAAPRHIGAGGIAVDLGALGGV